MPLPVLVSRERSCIAALSLQAETWDWAPRAYFPVLCRHLDEQGFSEALSLWLGSNLVPNGQGKLTWSFNVHGAKDMFESYNSLDYWGLLQDPPAGCTLNVVRAECSDRQVQPKQTCLGQHDNTLELPSSRGGSPLQAFKSQS